MYRVEQQRIQYLVEFVTEDDTTPDCPRGHSLTKHTVPRAAGWGCDGEDAGCAGFQDGDTAHGCRICNYDVCTHCHALALK